VLFVALCVSVVNPPSEYPQRGHSSGRLPR
jgi:hypothetical protein